MENQLKEIQISTHCNVITVIITVFEEIRVLHSE